MPFTTTVIAVKADLFMEHGGVKIFHTYEDDEMVDIEYAQKYWYVTDPDHDMEHAFDVRTLSTWREDPLQPPFLSPSMDKKVWKDHKKTWDSYRNNNTLDEHIKGVLRESIDKGELPLGDERKQTFAITV